MKREEIQQLLPEIFRRTVRPGSPITALLDVMEDLHQPSEDLLHELDRHFDPARCGDSMAPYLAGWVDLEWLLPRPDKGAGDQPRPLATGTGRLRQLIAQSHLLSQWRGTRRGLLLFLEMATGLKGFQIEEQPPDEAGRPRPFHMRVVAPENARPVARLLRKIIERERPVFVTFDLEFEAPSELSGARPAQARSSPRTKAKPKVPRKAKPKSKRKRSSPR